MLLNIFGTEYLHRLLEEKKLINPISSHNFLGTCFFGNKNLLNFCHHEFSWSASALQLHFFCKCFHRLSKWYWFHLFVSKILINIMKIRLVKRLLYVTIIFKHDLIFKIFRIRLLTRLSAIRYTRSCITYRKEAVLFFTLMFSTCRFSIVQHSPQCPSRHLSWSWNLTTVFNYD